MSAMASREVSRRLLDTAVQDVPSTVFSEPSLRQDTSTRTYVASRAKPSSEKLAQLRLRACYGCHNAVISDPHSLAVLSCYYLYLSLSCDVCNSQPTPRAASGQHCGADAADRKRAAAIMHHATARRKVASDMQHTLTSPLPMNKYSTKP